MKDVRAVVFKIRGSGLKCQRCRGAEWRKNIVKFCVKKTLPGSGGGFDEGASQWVCLTHLRDAVLEVWE